MPSSTSPPKHTRSSTKLCVATVPGTWRPNTIGGSNARPHQPPTMTWLGTYLSFLWAGPLWPITFLPREVRVQLIIVVQVFTTQGLMARHVCRILHHQLLLKSNIPGYLITCRATRHLPIRYLIKESKGFRHVLFMHATHLSILARSREDGSRCQNIVQDVSDALGTEDLGHVTPCAIIIGELPQY